MAVQYNSKEDSWGGFIVDIFKAKKGIVEVSDEATTFFEKTKDWDFGFVKEKLNGNIDETEKWIGKLELSDESLKDFLKTWDGSGDIAEAYQAHLRNSVNGLTIFQRAGKAAGTALKTLGATLANMALAWVISEAVSMIYNLVTASDRLQESAAKFGDEFASASSDIDNYKSKIAELHETINSSTASYEETYSAREELLKIQDEMIEKFGSEAESIDKVKDAINGVDEAFDSLTNDEWKKTKNDFNSDTGEGLGGKIAHFFTHDFGRSSNMDKMMEEMDSTKESFHIASAGKTKEEQEKIDKFVEELRRLYNINIYRDPDGHNVYDKIEVAGDNLKDVYDKMLDIQKLGENIGLDDSFLGNLSEKNGKIQNKIDQYDEMYNENIFQERVLKDENFAQKYKDITQAYKDSQEVIKNGETQMEIESLLTRIFKTIPMTFSKMG